jgi:hypothetical protein
MMNNITARVILAKIMNLHADYVFDICSSQRYTKEQAFAPGKT